MLKKLLKSRLLFFILGLTLASGISAVFAYSYLAQDVGYTPTDTTWQKQGGEAITNVDDALNELKDLLKYNIKVYETGSFSVYMPRGNYVTPTVHLKNTYVASDYARFFIYNVTPGGSPIYPQWGYSGSNIVGNTYSNAIINYAGSDAYSRTYTFKYAIISAQGLE